MKTKKEGHSPTQKQYKEFDILRKMLLASGKDLSKIKITTA